MMNCTPVILPQLHGLFDTDNNKITESTLYSYNSADGVFWYMKQPVEELVQGDTLYER